MIDSWVLCMPSTHLPLSYTPSYKVFYMAWSSAINLHSEPKEQGDMSIVINSSEPLHIVSQSLKGPEMQYLEESTFNWFFPTSPLHWSFQSVTSKVSTDQKDRGLSDGVLPSRSLGRRQNLGCFLSMSLVFLPLMIWNTKQFKLQSHLVCKQTHTKIKQTHVSLNPV